MVQIELWQTCMDNVNDLLDRMESCSVVVSDDVADEEENIEVGEVELCI